MKFQKKYLFYTILLLIVEILIALFVKDKIIRPYIGDYLVVILLYFLVKSFFHIPYFKLGIGVLLFAYLVEFLQYLNIVKVLGLADNRFATIVIGNHFEWGDMGVYTLGILTVWGMEFFNSKPK